MKYIIAVLMFVFVSSCVKQSPTKDKKNNEDYLLLSTVWFQKSAEVVALYHQGYNIAKMRIDQAIKTKSAKPYAVVLDIDETVLNNSPYEAWCVKFDSAFSPLSWNKWIISASAKPLPGAVEFTNYAKKNNVEVFYISNRDKHQLTQTILNLQNAGFPNANSSFVLLKDSTSNKSFRRAKVREKYNITLLLGDNLGDFAHLFDNRPNGVAVDSVTKYKSMFGDKYVILPNPMYGSWTKRFHADEKSQAQVMIDSLTAF